jgi:curli biogenesis system outer membrane secretion channel CsgG
MALFHMKKYILFLTVLLILSGCGDKKDAAVVDLNASSINTDRPVLTNQPDVGKVELIDVKAVGIGLTPNAAINEALKQAIQQINPTFVSSTSANVNYARKATAKLQIEDADGMDSVKATKTVQSQEFAEAIAAQSEGMVSSFAISSMTPPKSEGGSYSVAITAKIAKFKQSADTQKIKIVVADLKTTQNSFNIGGHHLPAQQVLEPIRQQIIDALTQSGRFTVLDRQFDADIEREMGLISSNQTNPNDIAKLGQSLSADIVWVGSVNALSYNRLTRKLITSDRELVSYSGDWSITQRLINLTSRQVMLSEAFNGTFPAVLPTSLGATIDEKSSIANVQAEVVKKAVDSIMLRTFPISIVSMDGTSVVLSQGQGSLTEGTRYKVYKLGKELKDPQTGQSLGNMESFCCEVVISRVTPKVSYGQLENVKVDITGISTGVLQIREKVLAMKSETNPVVPVTGVNKATKHDSSSTPSASSRHQDKDW